MSASQDTTTPNAKPTTAPGDGPPLANRDIHELVQERYGAVSKDSKSPELSDHYKAIAAAFGYGNDEIAFLQGANMGLSCGNPVATANLKEGEVVVDLGSGGGMDVFLAAQKVGSTGKAIGIDMTEGMIQLARRNASTRGLTNVEFIHSPIETIPLSSSIADCVVSNCVLNLVPEHSKGTAIKEIFRILKPGGRVAISDIVALEKEMPEELRKSAEAYVGCISGTITVAQFTTLLEQAGFTDITFVDSKADLNVYTQATSTSDSAASCGPNTGSSSVGCCAPPAAASAAPSCCGGNTDTKAGSDLGKYDLNQFVASYKIYAIKPRA